MRATSAKALGVKPHGARRPRADSNVVVHGLWIGSELSRLELLTLHSFVRFGHRFRLWTYDDLATPVPAGVELCDANEILPRGRIFRQAGDDVEVGLGKGSYGPFSDLFRYMLLWEHGGIWVDMDVTCLRPFDFKDAYLFRGHRIGLVGNVIKVPARSELMKRTFEETDAIADENVAWLTPNRILAKHVFQLGLERYIRSDFSNADQWVGGVAPFVEGFSEIPDDWYCIHWTNEAWRALRGASGGRVVNYVPDRERPFDGSTLDELYRRYGLVDPRDRNAPVSPPRAKTDAGLVRVEPQLRPIAYNVLAADPDKARTRTLVEAFRALAPDKHVEKSVYVVDGMLDQRDLAPGVRLTALPAVARSAWQKRVALDLAKSPLVFAHGIRVADLKRLENLGALPIPVIEDAKPDWLDPAKAYDDLAAPFLIANCDAVALELRQSGLKKSIITVRPELRQRFTPEGLADARRRMRRRFRIDDATIVIGMIGPFTPRAGYTRAVRILAGLRKLVRAKLVVVGGWSDAGVLERNAHEGAMRLAVDLGVISDIFIVNQGDEETDKYFGMFDVLLDTSIHGPLPVPILEAELSGCPVVASDSARTREIAPPGVILVAHASEVGEYVQAIASLVRRRDRVLASPHPDPNLVPRIFALLAKHGVEARTGRPRSGTLFVTADLHVGGPARSLANLLSNMQADQKNLVCVLGGISAETCRESLLRANVPILTMPEGAGLAECVERVLDWAEDFNVRNICFWNAPPEFKLLVAKVLSLRGTKLVDTSPGPMLFDELSRSEPFQRRISFTARQYIERLDTFVSLYRKGTPELHMGVRARSTKVIPLGVPMPRRFVPLPRPEAMLPEAFDERFAVGTVCRVVPDKKVDFLFEMMERLVVRVPHASLTIVGGPDDLDYWNQLQRRLAEQHPAFIRFVGRRERVNPFLATFKVFVMVGERQGCPNASLEAMAMRLPVVANPSGGTAEQIKNGVNGFLVEDSKTMAARVAALLLDARRARKMGNAGYDLVRKKFSVSRMVEDFTEVLSP